MSANTCLVYFGLRFEIPADGLEALETRSDQRIVAARKVGLKSYWGNFAAPEARYLLFIGAQVAVMGLGNQSQVTLSVPEFEAVVTSVRVKLEAAGLAGTPALHIEWQPDA
jgi:hypothetical protein